MLDSFTTAEGKAAIMFQLDFVDVDTYMRNYRRREFIDPEMKLMFAVLEDALNCLEKYLLANKKRGKTLYCEAEDWVFRVEDASVFSFDNVCDGLGLNPNYLRKGVRHWKQQALKRESKNIARLIHRRVRRRVSSPSPRPALDMDSAALGSAHHGF